MPDGNRVCHTEGAPGLRAQIKSKVEATTPPTTTGTAPGAARQCVLESCIPRERGFGNECVPFMRNTVALICGSGKHNKKATTTTTKAYTEGDAKIFHDQVG